MNTNYLDEFISLIKEMSGQETQLNTNYLSPILAEDQKIGYNQFNELLLLHGFNRISNSFFHFLVNGFTPESDEKEEVVISIKALRTGVIEAQKLFLLVFGNIRFGYRVFSENSTTSIENLESWLNDLTQLDEKVFSGRSESIINLQKIPESDTYYLGYVIEDEIKKKLIANPEDEDVKQMEVKRTSIVEMGVHNNNAYLTADFMDVYVATSMRTKHEFLYTGKLINEVFRKSNLSKLKVRWFDPTQAYCSDRIDKGLAEALMLKRAICTLYLAQETDTLGKDSELAVTLAQGKPVIAFVPQGDKEYVDGLIASYMALENTDKVEAVTKLLSVFDPMSAWKDQKVRQYLNGDSSLETIEAVEALLYSAVRNKYDSRAKTLSDIHPLGIQAQIETGLAIGVLVVRTYEDCAKLIESVILRRLEFEMESVDGHYLLKENISGSVYRVMTKDRILSNAFWNFYIN